MSDHQTVQHCGKPHPKPATGPHHWPENSCPGHRQSPRRGRAPEKKSKTFHNSAVGAITPFPSSCRACGMPGDRPPARGHLVHGQRWLTRTHAHHTASCPAHRHTCTHRELHAHVCTLMHAHTCAHRGLYARVCTPTHSHALVHTQKHTHTRAYTCTHSYPINSDECGVPMSGRTWFWGRSEPGDTASQHSGRGLGRAITCCQRCRQLGSGACKAQGGRGSFRSCAH